MGKYAIIVAGGIGSRMNSEIPKQFLKLDGKPILVHTINAFLQVNGVKIIVVLPESNLEYWEKIDTQYFRNKKIEIAVGGRTRTDSVRSGLDRIDGEGLVAIHDGARPYVSLDLIKECYESASFHSSGVAMVPLKDSIREKIENGTTARDRTNFFFGTDPSDFSNR